MNDKQDKFSNSRRSILKTGALASAASVLGVSGSAVAQESDPGDEEGTDTDGDGNTIDGYMFSDEYRPGAVVRISSSSLEQIPRVDNSAEIMEDREARVVEFFNTFEESYLFLPTGAQVEIGDLYVLGEGGEWVNEGPTGDDLVTVSVEPLQQEDFVFDGRDESELFEEGGGEAAVRPYNFYAGSMFRITSEPLGWLPDDVEESGLFTDYNARHAEYLGVSDEFLFFPQEDAEVETDAVYVMEDEFELFRPEGNLVAADFNQIDEETIPWDEDWL